MPGLNTQVPADRSVHVILDNYATHRHPKVRAGLDRNKRFAFHFTPTSCSRLDTVEGFFAERAKRRLKRGGFRSLVDLQPTINRFATEANENPSPLQLGPLQLDRRSR